jgi:hypothetical protein
MPFQLKLLQLEQENKAQLMIARQGQKEMLGMIPRAGDFGGQKFPMRPRGRVLVTPQQRPAKMSPPSAPAPVSRDWQ